MRRATNTSVGRAAELGIRWTAHASYTPETMSPKATEVLEQALALDEADRATVAGALIESLEGPADPDAEAAWSAVIKRRVEELESGSVETVPWSRVRERLFRGYE
ncbi:MAG: addiction module protein [Candidatus Binatia bacterium]